MEELNNYLEKLYNNNEYIGSNELDEIKLLFDKYDVCVSDRIKILQKIEEYNKNLFNKRKNKVVVISDDIKESKVIKASQQIKIEKQKVISPNVTFYLSLINELIKDDNYSLDDLYSILPTIDSKDCEKLINKIMISLYEEVVEYKNLINSLSSEEYFEYKKEVMKLENLIQQILNYKRELLKDEVLEEQKVDENILIYAKDTKGEPIIYSDLKRLEENYEYILKTLYALQNGDSKFLKCIVSNLKNKKIIESRLDQVRLLSYHLKDNIYVVLGVVIKKCDLDAKFSKQLILKKNIFLEQKDYLDMIANNQELLEEEQHNTERLIEYLNENKRSVRR